MEHEKEEFLFNYLSQYEKDDPLVREVLALRKEALLNKTAESNPLDNNFWETLVDSALKGLNVVAIASMDWKLLAVARLLSSWVEEKREEKRKKQQDLTLGVNYNITHPGVQITQDSYGGRSYY